VIPGNSPDEWSVGDNTLLFLVSPGLTIAITEDICPACQEDLRRWSLEVFLVPLFRLRDIAPFLRMDVTRQLYSRSSVPSKPTFSKPFSYASAACQPALSHHRFTTPHLFPGGNHSHLFQKEAP